MAEIQGQKLRGVVASMMEKQAQATKPAATGVLGSLWEKATGEIERYNKAVEEHVKLTTKQDRIFRKMEDAQERIDELNREIAEGLHDEAEAAKAARREIEKLTDQVEQLHDENRDLSESVNLSKQSMDEMNKGGGILKNGFVALTGKIAGATAAFFSVNQAIDILNTRTRFASKTISSMAGATGDYSVSFGEAAKATLAWNTAISETTMEMAKMGVNAEDSKKLMEGMADGLRLTTDNQGDLINSTTQVTQDIGVMSKLLRVNTDELAAATIDASKRFGKSTTDMSNDLAGLFDSIQQIKLGSKDTVINFGDLTRATLEAQGSFQGYNFNLKTTANVLGNVVAKAQEQGATYDMAMKAAKGLAGVITGGKAPDWAKYMAGKKLRSEVVDIVNQVKQANEELGGTAEQQAERMKTALRESFGKDISDSQMKGLENLAENWKRYGNLSSAKMAEELLRGTEKSNKEMFEMMKKQADRPEGRELLMRVWGLDEAAATAATLAITTAKDVSEFTKIADEAKAATEARKPPTVADLKSQTEEYVTAMAMMENGLGGYLGGILSALKESPLVAGAVAAGGTALGFGIEAIQTGIAAGMVSGLSQSKFGEKLGGVFNKIFGRRGAVGAAGGVADIGEAVTSMRSGGTIFVESAKKQSKVMGVLSKATSGASSGLSAVGGGLGAMRAGVNKLGGPLEKARGGLAKMGGPLGKLASSKFGMGALAFGAGLAVGSLLRLIPGVDSFTEGLINSTAKLIGFEGALTDAEAAQKALSNKSAVIGEAIKNVTTGITTDYEKDSLARMKAVVQLQNLSEGDLEAYAEKIAATKKLSKEEAMSRLTRLSQEKVDMAKMAAARKEALAALSPRQLEEKARQQAKTQVGERREGESSIEYEKRVVAEQKKQLAQYQKMLGKPSAAPEAPGEESAADRVGRIRSKVLGKRAAVVEGAAPVVTRLSREQKQAVTAQVAMELGPEMQQMAGPMFQKLEEAFATHWTTSTDLARSFWQQQLPAMAIDSWNRVGAAFEQRLGVPTSLPLPGGRAGAAAPAGTPTGAAGAGARMGGAVVQPDGTIRLNVMIPRDALDQSNGLAAGYSQ